MGKNAFIKSISTFITVEISNSPPPSYSAVNQLLYNDLAFFVVVIGGAAIAYYAVSRRVEQVVTK